MHETAPRSTPNKTCSEDAMRTPVLPLIGIALVLAVVAARWLFGW